MGRLSTRMQDTDPAAHAKRADRLRFGEWVWFGLLTLMLLMITAGALSAAAAVSPASCAMCHADQADTLARSSHSELVCDSCHASSGVLGLVENRLWVAGMVISAPVRAVVPSGANAQVDSGRCADCHELQMPVTSVHNGVRMNHAAPVKASWSCMRCHRDVGHGSEGVSLASYTMGSCLECHSTGPSNLASCETCHVEGESPSAPRAVPTTWAVTHGANWQRTHGMGDLPTCSACHGPDYCVGCHGVALPHAANYLSVHGDDVQELGETACTESCHRAESCDGCHGGVPMPHPASFIKGHKSEVEASGEESCARCHAESSCQGCHERHTHPGLSQQRLKGLRDRPVRVQ